MSRDPSADARLQRLFGGDALADLRARLRERYARGIDADVFTLQRLTPAARRALEGLLGQPLRSATSMRLSQAELDRAIARAGLAADLRDALQRLDGPIIDRAGQRAELQRRWAALIATATDPRLQTLLQRPAARGLLKRLAGGQPAAAQILLDAAAAVLQRLPAPGSSLARLAADATGDAHALDDGRGLAALVLRAALSGHSAADGFDDSVAEEVVRNRDRWALLGVAVNPLAAPALLLNLPVKSVGPARLLADAAALGEPFHLSLRTLLRTPPAWRVAGVDVFVCENPDVVVAAADRLGAAAAPLVCTDGMPSASQRVLLQQLAAAGANLHYHGDFDWPGLRIGGFVMRAFGARPWRFGAVDYRPEAGPALLGDPARAAWDPALTERMRACGRAQHEEAVIDELLQDLARTRRATPG